MGGTRHLVMRVADDRHLAAGSLDGVLWLRDRSCRRYAMLDCRERCELVHLRDAELRSRDVGQGKRRQRCEGGSDARLTKCEPNRADVHGDEDEGADSRPEILDAFEPKRDETIWIGRSD